MGWRFFATLALLGLLIGLMLGRLTDAGPVQLQGVRGEPERLLLWFDRQPEVRGEQVQGALVLWLGAEGRPAAGQLTVGGKMANWRLVEARGGLRLELVAARPLQGQWRGAAVDGRWRLAVELRPE